MALTANINKTNFGVGDSIAVHQTVEEEGKKRTQIFEGMVIGIKGSGAGKSFTVRKLGAANIGIERIFPLSSPVITDVQVTKKGTAGIRRSKLYYLRTKPKRSYDSIYKKAAKRTESKAVNKPKKSAIKKKSTKKVAKTPKSKKQKIW